jgi:hypothetical protein
MLDKQLHELIERLGDDSDSSINLVEFKIWERDSNGNLVSRPLRTVKELDSNSNVNTSTLDEPSINELGSHNSSKAGSSSSVSNQSNNVNNINKIKVINDFITFRGRLL